MATSKCEWRFVRNLGNGSFGVVELWKNNKSGKMNAVKRFAVRQSSQMSDNMIEEFKRLWRKEVELMSTISNQCPYIISAEQVPADLVLALGTNNVNVTLNVPPVLFMEYCSGGNLRTVLKLPENICGLKEADGLVILDQMSKAISFLHNNDIIHRDLKPDNILRFMDSNNRVIYKLIDLGFAKDVSKTQNQCSTFVGTPQYLAPEIYMGKTYDKTVDFWSFGIIAFELMCGLRPFLHGESPTNWLPLVEGKAKDIICFYRNTDGKICSSSTIPFYTHFSDMMKDCLVTWLRTMLQLDPSRRGRKINTLEESENDIVNLKLLNSTLSTKFLEINAIKERIAFPVGSTGRTKVADIKQKIALKTGLIPDNQLILTLDGVELQNADPASKYIGADLYLIPRCADLIRLKVKFPTIVNNFILQWDSLKDPSRLRKVWACAIYFLQTELGKVDTVKKSIQALRAWCNTNYTNQIRALQLEVEKCGSSLGTVLELESRLEAIDLECSDNPGQDKDKNEGQIANKTNQNGAKYWTEEMAKLHSHYKSCFDHWIENVVLKPISTTELEELYYKILKACGDWKSSASTTPPFSYNEILVKNVCQFIVKGNEIDESLLHNIIIQLDKVQSDVKLMEEIRKIAGQLNQLTSAVLQQRCTKQKLLVQRVNGTDFPTTLNFSENANQKENTPPNNNNNNNNIFSVRGGGHGHGHGHRHMSHSTLSPTTGKFLEMGLSLNNAMSTSVNLENAPLVSRLMQESQILIAQTEEQINSLSGSLEEMKELRKEKDSIKWDFLE